VVKIGDNEWILDKSGTSTYVNGDTISELKSRNEWDAAIQNKKPAWCFYKDIYGYNYVRRNNTGSERNIKKNGKLYNFYAVNDERLHTPDDWHTHSNNIWLTIDISGGKYIARRIQSHRTKTVKIGDQRVIIDNIYYSTFLNGDTIREVDSKSKWDDACYAQEPAWCFYEIIGTKRDIKKNQKYSKNLKNGKLYNSGVVSDQRSIDPDKWRNPSEKEKTIPNFYYDSISGKSNKMIYVKIGNQKWMNRNLNIVVFRNGDTIPEAKSEEEWKDALINKKPAWCYYRIYGNHYKWDIYHLKSEKKLTNGKLYNWYAVNDPRGLAPTGWHIPSENEWSELIEFLGGRYKAGNKLHEKCNKYWTFNNVYDCGATNETGFTDLSCGCRNEEGVFYNYKFYSFYWTSTELDSLNAFFWSNDGYCMIRAYGKKGWGLSVRCIKDE